MLVTGIFRANNPLNASILFVYGLLLKLPYFLSPTPVPKPSPDGFLFNELIHVLKPALESWPSLSPLIAYLLLFTQAISINYYVNSRKMLPKPNYLCAMAYLLISSFFASWNVLSAPLLVNTFLVWIWGTLTGLSATRDVKGVLFNIGFVIGICSFLYLPSVTLVMVVIFGLMILRPPQLAEWGLVIVGFITTWYFLFAWLFLTNGLYQFDIHRFIFDLPDILWTPAVYVGVGLIALLFFIGLYYMQDDLAKQTIQVRKRWSVLLISAIVLLVVPFLNKNEDLGDWILAVLAIAPFVGVAFYFIRSKWVRLVLHWSMVAFVIYCQYFK